MSDSIQILLIVALLATAFGAVIYARIGTSKLIWGMLVSILIILFIANVWWYFFKDKVPNPEGINKPEDTGSSISPDTSSSLLGEEKASPNASTDRSTHLGPSQATQETQQVEARNITLEGRIINRRTLTGVAGASISIDSSKVKSDSDGEFFFSNVLIPESGTEIRVSCPDFFSWTKAINPRSRLSESKLNVLLKPKLRVVFPPFQIDEDQDQLRRFATEFPEAMKQPFVKCQSDLEVFAYHNFPEVVREIERVQRLGQLMDPEQVLKIGRMSSANYLISGRIIQSDSLAVQVQMTEIETATVKLAETLKGTSAQQISKNATSVAERMIASMAAVLITSHLNGDTVKTRVTTLGGINSCIPSGYRLWISVQPHGGYHQYPQNNIDLVSDVWIVTPIYLGAENSPLNQPYIVNVILVSKRADKEFKDYMERGRRTGDYPGLELPEGARITHQITLVR